MKKLFLIFGITLSILLIAFAVWFVAIRDKTVPPSEAIRDLLPFGSGEGLDIPGFVDNSNEGGDSQFFNDNGAPIARLFPLSTAPVAGMTVFSRGTETLVRYVERTTGHIYEAVLPNTSTSSALERKKITNTTIPKIYEAYFRSDGGAVVLRALRNDTDTDVTTAVTLIPPTTSSASSSEAVHTLTSINLRGDTGSMSVVGNNIYYSVEDSGAVVSTSFNNSSTNTLFSSQFTDWKVVPSGNGVILQTKPSENSAGYAYSINAGLVNKLLGPLVGLSVVSNSSGNRLLYSHFTDSGIQTSAKNLQSGVVIDISPSTLAEKCVWSKINSEIIFCGTSIGEFGSQEVSNWYRGAETFSDYIWKHNNADETANIIINPKTTYELDLDVINPQLSPKEDYLIFINKVDMSLWALQL